MFRGKTFCRGYWLILPCSPLSPIFNYFFLRQPPWPHPGPPPHRSPHQPPCPPPFSLICSNDECSYPSSRYESIMQLLCPQFSVVIFHIWERRHRVRIFFRKFKSRWKVKIFVYIRENIVYMYVCWISFMVSECIYMCGVCWACKGHGCPLSRTRVGSHRKNPQGSRRAFLWWTLSTL